MPDSPTNVGSLNPPSATQSSPIQQSGPPLTPPSATPPPTGTLGGVGSTTAQAPPRSDAAKPPAPMSAPPPTPAIEQTSSGPRLLMKDGVPIEAKPAQPEIVAQAGAVQLKSDGNRLTAETIDVNPQNPPTAAGYVQIIPNPDGVPGARFRGVCTKCGFQSFQPAEILARQMIEYHAGKHLLGR